MLRKSFLNAVGMAVFAIAGLALAVSAHAAVWLDIGAEALKDQNGVRIPEGSGLVLVVADTFVNGFTSTLTEGMPLTVGSYWGDDLIVAKFAVYSGGFGDGDFEGFLNGLAFTGDWGPGDPIAIYWFSDQTLSDTVTIDGSHWNYNALTTDADWVTPWDAQFATMLWFTSDANTFGIGTLDPSLGNASRVVGVTGLVAYYPFNGNAHDESGNGNNGGIVGGATFTADRFGNVGSALSFDGISGAVEVPDSPSLRFGQTSPITVALWAYRTGSASVMHLLGKRQACDQFPFINYQIAFNTGSGEGMSFGAGGGGHEVATGRDLPQNEWHLLVGTFDGTTYRFYMDGQLIGTDNATLGNPITDLLLIGGSGSCPKFEGLIDDVRIYNRALSAQEVQQLYGQTQPACDILSEDFESYAAGSWPSSNWTPDANAINDPTNNQIEASPGGHSGKSLKLFGEIGGCWAALGYRQFSPPGSFVFECDVYIGSETLSGCHPETATIDLRQGTSWYNYESRLINFLRDGNIKADDTILGQFQTLQWYHVKVSYNRSGNQLELRYWIDGQYLGQVNRTITNTAGEDSLDHLDLTAQEGSVWFDNIRVTGACPPACTSVYQTTFSTDPGWTTTSPSSYYWNPGFGTYTLTMADASGSYATTPVTLVPDQSFKFEFDINISRMDWAGDICVGLFGATRDAYVDSGTHPFLKINFANGDLGNGIQVAGFDGSDTYRVMNQYPSPYALNTPYHAAVTFDHNAGTLAVQVTRKSDGQVIWSSSMSGVQDFANLIYFGASKVGDNYAPGATGMATIDNIMLCQPPSLRPPVAQCQAVTVAAGADCMANASVDAGSFDPDNDPITITQTPAGPYPLGTTSVTLTVADDKGGTNTCTAAVTVVDQTPPMIKCPADTVVDALNATGAPVTFAATATDNCGVPTVGCAPPSGSTFPIGVTTVICTATDAALNTSSCGFTVTVNGPHAIETEVLGQLQAWRELAMKKEYRQKLDEAIDKLMEALDPALWIDETHLQRKHGEEVFQKDKEAVQKLEELADKLNKTNDPLAQEAQSLIDLKVRSARILVEVALADASGKDLREGLKELAKGDTSKNPHDTIEHYKNAWKKMTD